MYTKLMDADTTLTGRQTMSDSNKRTTVDVKTITKALAEPFSQSEVKFKPQMVKNNKALALAYIDARVIQDRLDDVLGVEGWSDEYELLPDGSAVCRLRCKLGGEWLTKMDVGSPSEQPDAGDRVKAAFSDALKRAAVKFGIGRYLYRLPASWVDYDPARRQFVRPPVLPEFARPKGRVGPAGPSGRAAAAPAPEPDAPAVIEAPKPAANPGRKAGGVKAAGALPADGAELLRRLT